MTSVSVDENFMLYHNSPKMKIEKNIGKREICFLGGESVRMGKRSQ